MLTLLLIVVGAPIALMLLAIAVQGYFALIRALPPFLAAPLVVATVVYGAILWDRL